MAQAYQAWRTRDLDRVAAVLADDFSHVIMVPATVHPLGGVSQGKAPSLARLRQIVDEFAFDAYEVEGLIAEGDHAAAQVHLRYRHALTGIVLDTTLGHFWTVRQGLVVTLVEYHDMGHVQAFSDQVVELID